MTNPLCVNTKQEPCIVTLQIKKKDACVTVVAYEEPCIICKDSDTLLELCLNYHELLRTSKKSSEIMKPLR